VELQRYTKNDLSSLLGTYTAIHTLRQYSITNGHDYISIRQKDVVSGTLCCTQPAFSMIAAHIKHNESARNDSDSGKVRTRTVRVSSQEKSPMLTKSLGLTGVAPYLPSWHNLFVITGNLQRSLNQLLGFLVKFSITGSLTFLFRFYFILFFWKKTGYI
jgi:hypothetical protein